MHRVAAESLDQPADRRAVHGPLDEGAFPITRTSASEQVRTHWSVEPMFESQVTKVDQFVVWQSGHVPTWPDDLITCLIPLTSGTWVATMASGESQCRGRINRSND